MGNATRVSSPAQVDREHLGCVHAKMVFARRSPDEEGVSVVHPNYDMPVLRREVTIRDARPIANELSLDQEGFKLVQHKSAFAAGIDLETARGSYQEEMGSFIKDYFKASWVTPFASGPLVRAVSTGSTPGAKPVSTTCHVDYAPVAGPMMAASETQQQDMEIRSYSRLMIVQTWRALSPPPQDVPLAFCDANTAVNDDFRLVRFVGDTPDRTTKIFRSFNLCFNPNQRWYYFPNMTADEFVLFVGYDSDRHYHLWSPHNAFDNRHTFANSNPRKSVETRFLVYYDD